MEKEMEACWHAERSVVISARYTGWRCWRERMNVRPLLDGLSGCSHWQATSNFSPGLGPGMLVYTLAVLSQPSCTTACHCAPLTLLAVCSGHCVLLHIIMH